MLSLNRTLDMCVCMMCMSSLVDSDIRMYSVIVSFNACKPRHMVS